MFQHQREKQFQVIRYPHSLLPYAHHYFCRRFISTTYNLKVFKVTENVQHDWRWRIASKKLGIIDTERFISNLLRERFDYTGWRKKYFADVDLDTFLNEAAEYSKAHPFHGGKQNDWTKFSLRTPRKLALNFGEYCWNYYGTMTRQMILATRL